MIRADNVYDNSEYMVKYQSAKKKKNHIKWIILNHILPQKSKALETRL